jgi:two-component system, cell cycle response regulator DivK
MISRSPVVLLVDDHEDTVAMYAVGLFAHGFQPLTATDAGEAFSRACIHDPQVIVVDLAMSVRTGFDLIHQLREAPRTQDIPIIVLTGLTLASVRQHAREAGCDRFLLKPCLPEALAAEIRDVLLPGEDERVAV